MPGGIDLLPCLDREEWLRRRIRRAQSVLPDVRDLIAAVRDQGDSAVRALTLRYDQVDLEGIPLRVSEQERAQAALAVPAALRKDLEATYRRLLAFHTALELPAYELPPSAGVRLRLITQPLRRVAIYAPAGRAPLFSSVLMVAAAARAAGVEDLVLASPPGPAGAVSAHILLAADVVGIKEIYRVGGAQAIAALTFGTKEIRPADKIAGPGNRYVAAAKKAVYGEVDVDLVAGPSELLVVADAKADPKLIAADLLAQAEHDPEAEVALLALADGLIEEVAREIAAGLPAFGPARESLAHASACVESDLELAMQAADTWAPEHLELHVHPPDLWIQNVRAGSIFVGGNSPTALGDYAAGPTHVLPTGRTARALSGLSKIHFLRTFSVTEVDEVDQELFRLAARLARYEGLPLHARSLDLRVGPDDRP